MIQLKAFNLNVISVLLQVNKLRRFIKVNISVKLPPIIFINGISIIVSMTPSSTFYKMQMMCIFWQFQRIRNRHLRLYVYASEYLHPLELFAVKTYLNQNLFISKNSDVRCVCAIMIVTNLNKKMHWIKAAKTSISTTKCPTRQAYA